jgi:hypothetical protein
VETVAIATIGGIRVSSEDGFTMEALRVTIIRVASNAFLDHSGFIPFPWSDLMDIFMTVFTLNIVDEVST